MEVVQTKQAIIMDTNPQAGYTVDHWDGDYPVQMKRPLAALLMAPEFQDVVVSGDKTITIREGWRDYKVDEKVVLCHTNETDLGWAVMGRITQVSRHLLKDVALQDFHDDGMLSVEDAIKTLGRFYEGINGDSLVTVIRWRLL